MADRQAGKAPLSADETAAVRKRLREIAGRATRDVRRMRKPSLVLEFSPPPARNDGSQTMAEYDAENDGGGTEAFEALKRKLEQQRKRREGYPDLTPEEMVEARTFSCEGRTHFFEPFACLARAQWLLERARHDTWREYAAAAAKQLAKALAIPSDCS